MTLFARLLDLVFPPLCLMCAKPIDAAHRLCPSCWASVRFIGDPRCAVCGAPFDFPVDPGTLCAVCLSDPPHYVWARSAVVYDDASKGIILRLKHADHLHLARGMAQMMAAATDRWDEIDLIVPVPLHRWRLFARRYNQAGLLAKALAEAKGKLVDFGSLRRVRATPSQGHRKREERRKNVAKAFAVPEARVSRIAGKRVLLIDDVLTTGATADECACALIRAGAQSVALLTFAKTHLN